MTRVTFKPCTVADLHEISPQRMQRAEYEAAIPVSDELVRTSFALSAWVDGVCVGAGGFRAVWPGRAVAWALLSHDAGPVMLPIARQLNRSLSMCPARRIEMTTRADFLPGARLAELLGFKCETPDGMKAFWEDGSDAYLFARVKT